MTCSLRPGDWVEVKSEPEVVQTLDVDGCVEPLPFMAQMPISSGESR